MARPVTYKTDAERKEARRLNEQKRREKDPLKYSEYQKVYREKNKEKLKVNLKNWYIKNKDKKIKYNTEYCKNRMKVDPLFKFKTTVRGAIRKSFKRNKNINFLKVSKTENLLGCSLIEFKTYILSKCPEGTTLQDFHHKGYHLDHIIPISIAKSKEEIAKLCHYTNFQPLLYNINMSKSNKIINNVKLQQLL